MLHHIMMRNITVFTAKTIYLSNGVNIIHGDNRHGKTTIRQAISFLLSGECWGRDYKTLARIGANDESYVSGTIEIEGVKYSLLRYITSKKNQKDKKNDFIIENDINIDNEAVTIPKSIVKFLTDVNLFFSLRPHEQRQCLAIFMREIVPYKNIELITKINTALPGIIDTTKILTFVQVYKKLLDEHYQLTKKIELLESQRLDLLASLNNLKNEAITEEEYHEELLKLKSQLEDLLPMPTEYDEQLAKLDIEIRNLRNCEFISPLTKEKNKLIIEIDVMSKMLNYNNKPFEYCQLFKNIKCLSKDLILEHIKTITQEINDKKAELNKIEKKIKDEEKIFKINNEKKIKELLDKYNHVLNDRTEAINKVNEINKKIMENNNKVTELIQQLNAKLKVNEKMLTLKEEIDKIENRMSNLKIRLSTLEQTIKEIETDNDIALTELTDDSGYQFVSLVNNYGKHFSLCFRFEPIGEPCFYINGKHYNSLSASEKILTSVCFQLAFAKLSKLNLIIIDDIELVQKDTAEELIRFLLGQDVQVIILSHTYSKYIFNKEISEYVNNISI